MTERGVTTADLLELLVNLRDELSSPVYTSKRVKIVESSQKLLSERDINYYDEIEQDFRDPTNDNVELTLQISIKQKTKLIALQRLLDLELSDIVADAAECIQIQPNLYPLIRRYKLYNARKQVRRPSKKSPAFQQLRNQLFDAAELIAHDQSLSRALLPAYIYTAFPDTPQRPPASHK